MTKLNIESINRKAFDATTENARESFNRAFGTLTATYSRRLQLERVTLGDAFDTDRFYADNRIADEVIEACYKRPKLDTSGNPVVRKGNPVFETSRFNKRDVANAASIVRGGCRSARAKDKLVQTHGSIEAAVASADKLGGVLNMVPRLAKAGLVSNNDAANDAKNAAINAYSGETATASARKALLVSLYGENLTTAQIKLVTDALTAWTASETAAKAVKPYVAPKPLTFDAILGKVVEMKRPRRNRRTATATTATETATETTETAQPLAQAV